MTNSEKVREFRKIVGKFAGFKTNTGYLFTDGKISLEVFRVSNVVTVFSGNAILFG
jgi:hypothetical protein